MEKFDKRHGSGLIKNRKNGVGDVNWRWIPFLVGFFLALTLPFFLDFVLFGSPVPCETIQSFEDGSSIQKCSVRN